MNQKKGLTALAIFIGVMMILSAFPSFIMRGGNEAGIEPPTQVSVDAFGVQGKLVDSSFNSLDDLLKMSPENTSFAYWINLENATQNFTDVARDVLPMTVGLSYGNRIYQSKIERLGAAYFNSSLAEFHWIRPYRVAYNSLVVPYDGYMMIPQSSDYSIVLGKPVLFGSQQALEGIIDVVSGGLSTDKFTLPADEQADLQVASLNGKETSPAGSYQEFYLGVKQSSDGYDLSAKYLKPDSTTALQVKGISNKYGLSTSSKGVVIEVSGTVDSSKLKDILTALLKP